MVAALVLALVPGRLLADSKSDDDARRHFERGQRHYNVGDFDAAIDEFKHAYEMAPVPGLLFNIAQAYRAKKDREKALYFYTTYLREDPAAAERDYVEARMKELRESEVVVPPPARSAPFPAPGPVAAEPPRANPGRGLRIAGYTTLASGAAFVGAAVVFALKSSSASDEVSQAFATHATWTPHLSDVYSAGQREETAAWVFGAVGAAAVVTGGILTYLGARERSVGVAMGSQGGQVTFSCEF